MEAQVLSHSSTYGGAHIINMIAARRVSARSINISTSVQHPNAFDLSTLKQPIHDYLGRKIGSKLIDKTVIAL